MQRFNIKTSPIYILLLIYLTFATLYGYKNIPNTMSFIINPLFCIGLFIFSLFLSDAEHTQRIKAKINKYQTTFIIVISYSIIEILLGLFLGYTKNIYSHTLIGMVKNIWVYITPIVFIELLRNILIRNTSNNKILFILIVAIFTLIDLNLHIIIQKNYSTSELFKLLFSTIIPIIISNLVLTYTTKTAGYITNLIYKIPQSLTTITLPIVPSLDWYFKALLGILLPLITFVLIRNIDNKIESIKTRTNSRKIKILPFLIPLIIFALFVAGFFKYKPTAIMSNSMHPIYNRGDVVIIEKSNKTMLKNLKNYDIIEYILDGTIVAHRVIHIEKHNEGEKLYITKGDNNNLADNQKVTEEQILGKVKFRIPKIGYPSVWLNEFLNKKEVAVETGK